jgi:hypothetical protein
MAQGTKIGRKNVSYTHDENMRALQRIHLQSIVCIRINSVMVRGSYMCSQSE